MESKIKINTDEVKVIEWSCPEKGYGVLIIQYNGKGGFTINAEYMKFDFCMEVMKSAGL